MSYKYYYNGSRALKVFSQCNQSNQTIFTQIEGFFILILSFLAMTAARG